MGVVLPFGFGMNTRRTACAVYCLASDSWCSVATRVAAPPGAASICWIVTPSTPGAPSLAATRSQAAASHVEPSDQAIQPVKPERRLSLRFLVQRLSQRDEFPGRRFSLTTKVFGRDASVVSSVMAGVFFRNRLSTCLTQHCVGRGASLHGRYNRFPATTAPSDSRPGRPTRYAFRVRRSGYDPQPTGALRFLDFSFETRRLPLSRKVGGVRPMGGSSSVDPFRPRAGSPSLAGWPLSSLRFEASREFTGVTANLFASRGFDRPIARPDRPFGYMCHRHFT